MDKVFAEKAETYRARAGELRAAASNVQSATVSTSLLAIAAQYESMAHKADVVACPQSEPPDARGAAEDALATLDLAGKPRGAGEPPATREPRGRHSERK